VEELKKSFLTLFSLLREIGLSGLSQKQIFRPMCTFSSNRVYLYLLGPKSAPLVFLGFEAKLLEKMHYQTFLGTARTFLHLTISRTEGALHNSLTLTITFMNHIINSR
jgi:hypothetical protein